MKLPASLALTVLLVGCAGATEPRDASTMDAVPPEAAPGSECCAGHGIVASCSRVPDAALAAVFCSDGFQSPVCHCVEEGP